MGASEEVLSFHTFGINVMEQHGSGIVELEVALLDLCDPFYPGQRRKN